MLLANWLAKNMHKGDGGSFSHEFSFQTERSFGFLFGTGCVSTLSAELYFLFVQRSEQLLRTNKMSRARAGWVDTMKTRWGCIVLYNYYRSAAYPCGWARVCCSCFDVMFMFVCIRRELSSDGWRMLQDEFVWAFYATEGESVLIAWTWTLLAFLFCESNIRRRRTE